MRWPSAQASRCVLQASMPRSGAGKTQHPRVPRRARAWRSAPRPPRSAKPMGMSMARKSGCNAERGDAGQALNADWPARIFPSDHPSGFAAVNAEEAHERNIPIMLHMRAEEVKLQGRQLAHSASALLEYLRHVKGSIIALTVEVLLCDQMERQHWIIVRLPDKKAS